MRGERCSAIRAFENPAITRIAKENGLSLTSGESQPPGPQSMLLWDRAPDEEVGDAREEAAAGLLRPKLL